MPTTAYCYDAAEREHDLPGHPENRHRLQRTLALLTQTGCLRQVQAVPCTPLRDERLLRVHSPQHVAHVEALARQGGGYLDPDTYVRPASALAARLAAGGLTNLTLAVLDGQAGNGFALLRPPGHHATAAEAMGFCLYNNVALAAAACQAERGLTRILIVDFDVHHGNGTQDIFYHDAGVLFFSTHQYPYYPGTGSISETGAGPGVGATANVPLPPGVGDQGYAAIYERILWPLARRFQPQLILASAGYDAHWDDPLAGMTLSLTGYAHLVSELLDMAAELCAGKIVFALEGGYNLDVLAHGVNNTLWLLQDRQAVILDPFGPARRPERDISALLQRVAALHGLAAGA